MKFAPLFKESMNSLKLKSGGIRELREIEYSWMPVHGRCIFFLRITLLLIVLNIVFLSLASANYWGGYVKTDNDYWSIHREGRDMNFDYFSSVEADCHKSNVTTANRVADVRSSVRTYVHTIDTTLKESTTANQGSYKSDQAIRMKQFASHDVNMTLIKNTGDPNLYINWAEQWPSRLILAENLEYAGKGISNRQAVYSEIDYEGAFFNYNTKLKKTNLLDSYQNRTNISVIADDSRIKSIDLSPTGTFAYKLESSSDGITDLKFRHRGANQFISPKGLERREEISEGDERYVGEFNISRYMITNTSHILIGEEDGFLPCCMGGFEDLNALDKRQFKSASGIFDCTCFEVPKEAEFSRV